MASGIDKKTVDNLARDLTQERISVSSLNITKINHRYAFLKAIKERPALLAKINGENAEKLLERAITENFEYFVHLDRNQYTDRLAQAYMWGRLTDSDDKKAKRTDDHRDDQGIVVQKSIDEKILFTYSYVTGEGEELSYYDSELELPLSLKSSIKLVLKLNDAIALINTLDTHIAHLGEQKIKSTITDIVSGRYNAYLSEYISENKIGYYQLCNSVEKLERGLGERLAEALLPYGITVSELYIRKIAIPKDIQNKVEDLAFSIRQKRAMAKADADLAKMSLDSYESKLELAKKYPETELALTEHEKDRALDRYLEKNGKESEQTVDHHITLKKGSEKTDAPIKIAEDVKPNEPRKANIFLLLFIIGAVILAIISFGILSESTGIGLIALGASVGILGVIAAFNTDRFRDKKEEFSLIDKEVSD